MPRRIVKRTHHNREVQRSVNIAVTVVESESFDVRASFHVELYQSPRRTDPVFGYLIRRCTQVTQFSQVNVVPSS